MGTSLSLLPTPACSTCTLCSHFCSNIASSTGTTATSSSGSNCGTQRCSRNGTCRVGAVRQKVADQKVAATPRRTPFEPSCNNKASSRQTNPSPTAKGPDHRSLHCNQTCRELLPM